MVLSGGGSSAVSHIGVLKALAKSEKIEVSDKEINSKLEQVEADIKLSNEKKIDAERLKEAIADDLLQEKLFVWLEENNTVVEKPPEKARDQRIRRNFFWS